MLNYAASHAQDAKMNKEVKEMVSLGKDSIVQLALELVDERVGVENFSKVTVMTDGKEIYVSFLNPIKYLPMNSVCYFDLGVNLLDKVSTYEPVSNGTYDSEQKISFYRQTQVTQERIQFVLDAINASDEVGSIDIASFEGSMTILEQENYYAISIISTFQESSYKVEKASGRLYDAVHAHLVSLPFENEITFMEVK